MFKRLAAIVAALVFVLNAHANPTVLTKNDFVARPATDILLNPGIGLSDFLHTVPYPYNNAARPTSKVAYYRWYWKDLEPTEGVYNFAAIDAAIATAAARKQVLGIRIMSAMPDAAGAASIRIPLWLKSKIENLGSTPGIIVNSSYFFPNYNDPTLIDASRALLTALGQHYNNNPHIYFVDVGMVGLWGEWHDGTGGITNMMPTQANIEQYVDMHQQAFTNKPLVMLIGTKPAGLQYAADTYDAGWRADGWGDYRFLDTLHDNWTAVFPTILAQVPAIEQNWTSSPILLETYNTLYESYGLCFTTKAPTPTVQICNDDTAMLAAFDFAIQHRVSSINTPGRDAQQTIPASIRTAYLNMVAKLGYRYLLTETTIPAVIERGKPVAITSTWKNIGIAPVYANFKVGYRLRSTASGAVVAQQWTSTTANLKSWLPFDVSGLTYTDSVSTSSFAVINSAPNGTYKLDIAILSEAGDPIQLAITTPQQTDGWYEVSDSVSIKTSQTITVTTGAPATATFNDSFPVAATATSGLPVAITASGGCSIAGGVVTMTSASTNCVVNFNQSGDTTYAAAPQITQTVATGVQHGLTGTYYNGTGLTGSAVLTRVDSNIDFNWDRASPGAGVNADYFSARWTGRLLVPAYSGTYEFCVKGDDGVRLWVNNTQLIDKWVLQDSVETCTDIALTAGQSVPIQLDFYDAEEEAIVRMRWSYGVVVDQVVPTSNLYAQ